MTTDDEAMVEHRGSGEGLNMSICQIASINLNFILDREHRSMGRLSRRKWNAHIRRKARGRRNLICAIEQRIENICRIIHLLQIGDRLNGRPEYESWKQHRDTIVRLLCFHVFPDGFLGLSFGDAVADIRMLGLSCIFDGKLFFC